MMNFKLPIVLIFSFLFLTTYSRSEKRKIFAKKVSEEIVLDGQITESFWEEAQVSSDFVQYSPRDSILAELQSEFRVAYDDKYIYIAAKMEHRS